MLIWLGLLVAALLAIWATRKEPKGFEDASFAEKISSTYLNGMLRAARTGKLTKVDFAGRPANLTAANAFNDLSAALDIMPKDAKLRLVRCLLKTLHLKIVYLTALDVAADLVTYTRPLFLGKFLESLKQYRSGAPIDNAVYYACFLASTQVVAAALRTLYSMVSNTAFVTTRSSLMGVIFRKAMFISESSRETYNAAKIMNLLNVDTALIQTVYSVIPNLIGAPLGLIVCSWQLYHFLGPSTLAAVPVYLLALLYNSIYMKRTFKRFPERMAAKDKRTKATWNILRNIKSLKLYTWEAPFYDRVANARNEELAIQAKYLRLGSIMNSIFIMLNDFVATAIFVAYLYFEGAALTPEIVFPTLSLLSFLSTPLFAFPRAVTSVGQALTSSTRINEFLKQPEPAMQGYTKGPGAGTVVFKAVTSSWTEEENKEVLHDVSLQINSGDLCCVVGRVGAGKTALLRTIAGLLPINHGTIDISGNIAFCTQDPWLQFRTVRENIVFGLKFDAKVYHDVVQACELNHDFESLPLGDLTEVGEKGIILSGGQKARVALARAIFSRADIYVLDDVLSAVDEHISQRLINNLLGPTGLLASKTIILGTNTIKVLPFATRVVVLAKGQVTRSLYQPNKDELTSVLHEIDMQIAANVEMDTSKRSGPQYVPPEFETVEELVPDQEENEEGSQVDVFYTFRRYLKSVGRLTAVLAVGFLVLSLVVSNSIMVWLTVWADKELVGIRQSRFYLIVYVALSALAGLLVFLSNYMFLGVVAIRASRNLHNSMLKAVVRAPLTFFEQTPMGSIMNRFTGDMATMDGSLPNMNYYFFRTMISTVASFCIVIVGAPFVLVIIVPLSLLYNYLRLLYIPASRQMQRISSTARAPILSHIEESIKGISTVRAFGRTGQFTEAYEVRSDYWTHVAFLRATMRRWLTWRIDCMSAVLTFGSAICVTSIIVTTSLPVGIAGIVLHSTQRAGMLLSGLLRSWTDMEVSAVAVERVLEYIDLPSEAPEHGTERLPELWPSKGAVTFCNLNTRYRPELPLVLRDLSLAIKSHERIGIVGRTGAGKSSLTLAIFRIIEPSSGYLNIDGVNTSTVGLHDLRSKLSVIPQDAQIFGGTLRSNLDPQNLESDSRLWRALELCHLKDHFESQADGLETMLFEGGENLSRGQAQLICLGRALLRNSSILVLDEATASVDSATDKLIQETLRAEFTKQTIITIAHRINTVLDYDRIAVMDAGKVIEFDTPANLIAAKGVFYSLTQAYKHE